MLSPETRALLDDDLDSDKKLVLMVAEKPSIARSIA